MRLNNIEFLIMNNFIRRLIQKLIEINLFNYFLKKHRININNAIILDAGCGSGYSTKLISKRYNPKELLGFDIMPEQIKLAKKRSLSAYFKIGDITNIDSPSNKYNVVFVFGILHHVPEWKKAISEIFRVLKPEGKLLIEDINKNGAEFFTKFIHFNHPKEARFDWSEFKRELNNVGFNIIDSSKIIFDFIHSYLCIKNVANGA